VISVRTRFEIFKRDRFTCRYCGGSSPDVVLQVDHITPVCDGGSDDPINLATSCWACNSGKSGVPLTAVLTGEDPHDRAVALLENERQLREYNAVLASIDARINADLEDLQMFWGRLRGSELSSLRGALTRYPCALILRAMDAAVRAQKTDSLAYVHWWLNKAQREESRG
jgi:hypothetical protein